MNRRDPSGFAAVAVPVPVRRLFTYRVPASLAGSLAVGVRVKVPFGPRTVTGTVVELPAEDPGESVKAREILGLAADDRRLPPEILELTRFVADYYLCSWGEAIETALPPAGNSGPPRITVRRAPGRSADELPARAVARRRVIEALPENGSAMAVDQLAPADRRLLPALERDGWVVRGRATTNPIGEQPQRPPRAPALEPTPGQAEALALLAPLLDEGAFAPVLLHGATGSGKTEVYFRAAEQVLAAGRGVIYLVPEIGLTPLLLSRVSARFGDRAVVMHSALPRARRVAAWEALRDGRSRFVVGTRSAIFAPLQDPGLIVIDEEQDGSYKQAETPRYNARDLAVVRGRQARSVVLLGSATPSMESYHHARNGRYLLIRLGGRVQERPLPEVEVVDMREEYRKHDEVTPVSESLFRELAACLVRGDQALVLRNRRGWAPALFCPTCGERVRCNDCSVALTWHRADQRLRCHYCNFETRFPDACPHCRGDELKLLGEGTEQVEELLRERFPEARIARMDRDVLRKRGAHEKLLRSFDRREIDILVGTQMIAKGHDFPRVTLVGVISADHSLGLPDFRAGERTFQLLTQVFGRAGRGERPGRVVAQAFDPGHPLIGQAVAQDFEKFYENEVGYRRALRYPPFAAVVQLLIHDPDEGRARQWAAVLADHLREVSGGRLLLAGPGPAPIERLRGRFRMRILARSAGRRRLVEAVDRAVRAAEGVVPRKSLVIDVDPLSVL